MLMLQRPLTSRTASYSMVERSVSSFLPQGKVKVAVVTAEVTPSSAEISATTLQRMMCMSFSVRSVA